MTLRSGRSQPRVSVPFGLWSRAGAEGCGQGMRLVAGRDQTVEKSDCQPQSTGLAGIKSLCWFVSQARGDGVDVKRGNWQCLLAGLVGKNLVVSMDGMNRKRGTEGTGIFILEASKIDFFSSF